MNVAGLALALFATFVLVWAVLLLEQTLSEPDGDDPLDPTP